MREGDFLVQRYRLDRRIGRGSMGQVWLAHDNLLNRHVAIKHLLTGSQEELDDDVVQRAMREARLAAQLNHPNVVQIYDLVMSADMPYVVMEFVQGETLADRLESAGRLSPDGIRPVIRQVATCLAAAHELGIVHRDVKPANILIAPNGVAKLADFGIARATQDPNLTRTGFVIGTLAYMAPEVAAGDPATPFSDVWSLGATAYAATEGRAPFAGESSARALYRKVSEPPPVPAGAGDLAEIMQAMMATDPAHRPAVHEVAAALEGSGSPRWAGSSSPPLDPTYVRPVVRPADPTNARPQGRPATDRLTDDDRFRETDLWSARPLPAEPRRGRKGLIAALVVLAVLIAGGSLALVLGNRTGDSGDKAAAGSRHSSAPPRIAPAGSTATTASRIASSSTPVTSAPSVAPTPASTAPTASFSSVSRYYGPDGLSAEGPASWNNSCAGADGPYYWCAGPAGFLGGYFRLRLKNAHTSSFAADVQSENTYFRTQYPDGVFADSTVTGWPVSENAVDVSYSFTNSQGQARRGVERVFTVDGARTMTFIVATTGTRSAWPQTQQVFAQLIGSVDV